MATFSWSDNLKIAFRSCSPCLWPLQDDDELLRPDEGNRPINRRSLSRFSELQDLLENAESTDNDAERMSLHSNPGRGSSSQRKKKNTRRRSRKTSSSSSSSGIDNPHRITLFGYNLFGRPLPIQLADDSEDALYSRRGTMTPNTLNHSTMSSTFDSDAAPLDTDTIAALSSPITAAAAVQASAEVETQRLKEKEERRRKRKEKKELKRVAELLARPGIIGDGEEFEGFQGSGAENPASTHSTYPRIPAGMLPSGSGQREQPMPGPSRDDDDDDDKADLDGSHYAHNASGGSNRGSDDSRSRTSTTLSDTRHLPSEHTPITKSKQKKPKDESSSSRTTKSSSSSSDKSQFPFSPQQIVSPTTIEQGQGFFDLEDDSSSVKKPDPGYLPITGFGGSLATSRMASNLGAILAQRGGDASGN